MYMFDPCPWDSAGRLVAITFLCYGRFLFVVVVVVVVVLDNNQQLTNRQAKQAKKKPPQDALVVSATSRHLPPLFCSFRSCAASIIGYRHETVLAIRSGGGSFQFSCGGSHVFHCAGTSTTTTTTTQSPNIQGFG